MTEQIQAAPKPVEKSTNYLNCRFAYDCLMASTKSFVHHFDTLTPEEKREFKSLINYVKQLEKRIAIFKGINKIIAKPIPKPVEGGQPTVANIVAVAKPKVTKKKVVKKDEVPAPVPVTAPTPVPSTPIPVTPAVVTPVPVATPEPEKKKSGKGK